MSSNGLKCLSIEHLRGSVVPFTLPFEKGKKLTVVYGENGSGKSTICDGFDFLGNGTVGSLENRGLGQCEKFWPSVGKQAADISVTLEYADGASCSGRVVRRQLALDAPAHRPHVAILRRSQLLGLIGAPAAKRYEEIKRFIDVSGIEASEATLRSLIGGLRSSNFVIRIQENREEIERRWVSAGKPGDSSLSWAATDVQQDPNALDAEVAALEKLQSARSRLEDCPSRLASAVSSILAARKSRETAQQEANEALQHAAADAGEITRLLSSARDYLHSHPALSACPVCESSEKIKGLGHRLSERLASLTAVSQAQSRLGTTGKEFERAEAKLAGLREEIRQLIQRFEEAKQVYTWSPDIQVPMSPPEDITDLAAWISSTESHRDSWKEAITDRQLRKRSISDLKSALQNYNSNVERQKEVDVLLPKLERTMEVVQEERRAFTDEVLAKIAAEVGRLYEVAHPGEGLNKITLQLDPSRRASLDIGTEFYGSHDAPPQAYFSDSHLDTLGLCVFLALAAMEAASGKILILDDVLGSVDEPHVDRLIEMIYAEAEKFAHCILTTHYGPWRHKLRWGWLKNGQCQFVELSHWTSTGGLRVIRSIPDIERLRSLLSEQPPDPQLICAKAGVILEATLDFLVRLYGCRVPIREGHRYTLGDLLPAVGKKLRDALMVDILVKDAAGTETYQSKQLKPILDDLERIAQLRNVTGAHFNELSFQLLDKDATEFGQSVLELSNAIVDPDAGWPRSNKSGSYWANSGETRRLHPLEQPK